MPNSQKNKKCYNCKFGGNQFKIAGKTHLHCLHKKWEEEYKTNPTFSGWETLKEFWETCKDHEFNEV